MSPATAPAARRLLAAIPRAVLDEAALATTGFGAAATLHVRTASFVDAPEPRFSGVVEVDGADLAGPLPAGAVRLDTTIHVFVDRLGAAAPPADGVTLIAFVRRKAGMTLADFRAHSLSVHGPMDAAMPGLLRYDQAHAEAPADGGEPAFDCVSLFDFPDLATLQAAMAAPGSAASAADLANFVDLGSAVVLLTRPVRPDAGRPT